MHMSCQSALRVNERNASGAVKVVVEAVADGEIAAAAAAAATVDPHHCCQPLNHHLSPSVVIAKGIVVVAAKARTAVSKSARQADLVAVTTSLFLLARTGSCWY